MNTSRNFATDLKSAISACLLIAFSILPVVGHGDALDEAIMELMRRKDVPGLSLAVIDGGEIAKARAYGVVKMGSDAPVTEAPWRPSLNALSVASSTNSLST